MRRILVLTKNILVEQTFQQQLQHLNYGSQNELL